MSAPSERLVDQFTGRVADRPSAWWGALSEADEFIRKCDGVREQDCRIAELEAEVRELRTELARVRTQRDTANARRGW